MSRTVIAEDLVDGTARQWWITADGAMNGAVKALEVAIDARDAYWADLSETNRRLEDEMEERRSMINANAKLMEECSNEVEELRHAKSVLEEAAEMVRCPKIGRAT